MPKSALLCTLSTERIGNSKATLRRSRKVIKGGEKERARQAKERKCGGGREVKCLPNLLLHVTNLAPRPLISFPPSPPPHPNISV